MPRLRRRDPDTLPFLQILPNLVTIVGLSAGLTSIRFAIDGRFELAAGLIVLAAVIDGLDGLIARRLRAVTRFGAELDSLSDFVCFGVAPGVLVYRFAMDADPGLGWVFVLMFAICCCLRLARFNVHREEPALPGKPRFIGVPAPAGAMLALMPVFMTLSGIADLRDLTLPVAFYLGLVGVLMISRVPTLSPKALRISRDLSRWLMIGMAVLIGLMFTRFWLLMVLLNAAYAVTLVWVGFAARRERHRMDG